MKTIAEQIAECQTNIDTAEERDRMEKAELLSRMDLLNLISENFSGAVRFSPYSAYADGVIMMISAGGVGPAIADMERLDLCPMVKVRDGCASFRPEGVGPIARGEITYVEPYAAFIEGFSGDKYLFGFKRVGSKVFEIRVLFVDTGIQATFEHRSRRNQRPEVINVRAFDDTGTFSKRIFWSRVSDEYPNDVTFYSPRRPI